MKKTNTESAFVMADESTIVTVRMDQSEEDWIIEKGKESGVSKSRYMRMVTLGELPQAEVPFATGQRSLVLSVKVTHEELEDVISRQIPKVGNNLNQITRKVNSKEEFDGEEREEIIKEIKNIRKEMSRLISIIAEAIL